MAMTTKKTQQDINEEKWRTYWEDLVSYIQGRIEDCFIIIDTYSVGISYKGTQCQLRGADKTFKFDKSDVVFVKAVNPRSGKFIKVYEILVKEKKIRNSSQAHIISYVYSEEALAFLQKLRDVVEDFHKPNAIKFIIDS